MSNNASEASRWQRVFKGLEGVLGCVIELDRVATRQQVIVLDCGTGVEQSDRFVWTQPA